MGSSQSALQQCLTGVCAGRSDCAGWASFPNDPIYQVRWVKPYNLDSAVAVSPVAVAKPTTADEVSGFIKCATANHVKVQAKSGGHSYGNYGLGGPGSNNTLALDMANFQKFEMDTKTWQATIGPGTVLEDLQQRLHDNGKRAISHGACPSVGLGGHASIGGLGAMSRMWGATLDHVLEVEIVTADGKIQRASETQNSDLFFALRGAGAGFGVITEFVVRTHAEPGSIVQYTYTFSLGHLRDQGSTFKAWQDLISDPKLDRRFASEIIINPLGCVIECTFFGTEAEFQDTGIPGRLPNTHNSSFTATDWLGALAHNAETEGLYLSSLQTPFYSKSLGFRQEDLLSEAGIKAMFDYLDSNDAGTILWAIIFDLEGGATNDVALNASAYPHRDKTMFYQSYAVAIPRVSSTTRKFLTGLHDSILDSVGRDKAWTTYAGYVDPDLGPDAQSLYWGENYPTLQAIKTTWDANDVFHNPQSVRPKAGNDGAQPPEPDPQEQKNLAPRASLSRWVAHVAFLVVIFPLL